MATVTRNLNIQFNHPLAIIFTALLLVLVPTIECNLQDNTIDVETAEESSHDDSSPLAEAAAAILKEQNAESIGGLVNNLLQSGDAKHLTDAIMNVASNFAAGSARSGPAVGAGPEKRGDLGDLSAEDDSIATGGEILLQGLQEILGNRQGQDLLQGIGSLISSSQGFEPSILNGVVSMLMSSNTPQQPHKHRRGEIEPDISVDWSAILSLVTPFLQNAGGGAQNNLVDFIPTIVQSITAFVGPEADARVKSHGDHVSLLPPVLEKFHILFDHFMHSEMGRQIINTIGAEKFIKIFADDQGKFSWSKFAEMMENQSFRRHWIQQITGRLIGFLTYFSEPKVQQSYLATVQHFINQLLISQGYPKATHFDPHRASETITALVNHVAKQHFNLKINAKEYVVPAVGYAQELVQLAQANKGTFLGLTSESRQLSEKLADTINMEVIEPLLRVNRAYRFAKRVPKCDQYVMCLVNQEHEDVKSLSLPGLRRGLSKSASVIYSWFLSSHTGTPFMVLYSLIMEEKNCNARFLEACNDFHEEEVKVTTEYVHNEL